MAEVIDIRTPLPRMGTRGPVEVPVHAIRVDGARLPVRFFLDAEHLDLQVGRLLSSPELVDPIRVWEAPKNSGEYHLVSGLHRLEAHRALGRTTIQAVILTGSVGEIARIAVDEIPVGPGKWSEYEKAEAHGRAMAIFGFRSARQYAHFLGRGRNEISRHLRIHKAFPWDRVLVALRERELCPSILTRLTKERLCDLAMSGSANLPPIDRLIAFLVPGEDRGHAYQDGWEDGVPTIAPQSETSGRKARYLGLAMLVGIASATWRKLMEITGTRSYLD